MTRQILSLLLVGAAGAGFAQAASVVDAAAARDFANVRRLLAEPAANPNQAQPDGTTALHWAAHWNDLDAVKILLKAGADAKAANRFGATPLSEAAGAGNAPIIEALLAAGADPKTLSTRDGETVLMTAARAGNLDAVRALVARGADVNAKENYRGQTALMWAAAERHAPVVKFLLEHGADTNVLSIARENKMPKLSAASSVTPMARGGLAALHFAAREGDVESAKAMLDAGGNVDIVDADGTTAMSTALMNKQYTFARFLLDRGANPNLADARGRTALYSAIDARNEDYSALPMRVGEDPMPSIEIIKALLARKADVNAVLIRSLPGRSGMDAGDTTLDAGATPLMRAARAGDAEVMGLLLEAGADSKRTTKVGNDALLFAAGVGYRDKNTHGTEEGSLESVKLLMKQGMDLKAKNARGETALHGAAGRGADQIVRYLVQQGAEVDQATNQGLTPLDYAMGKSVLGQLPVPHDSTVVVMRQLGGHAGKPVAPPAPRTLVNVK